MQEVQEVPVQGMVEQVILVVVEGVVVLRSMITLPFPLAAILLLLVVQVELATVAAAAETED
jgi:hypothetical protein